jgi:hypothetical protein
MLQAENCAQARHGFANWRFWPRGAGRRRGTAAIEFAIVMPAFLAAVIGVVEIGWQLTIASALDRATLRAGRFGSTGLAGTGGTGSPTCRSQSIPWLITNSTGNVLKPERLSVSMGAVGSASGLGGTAVAGAGLGGQVVTYNVTYTQPFITLAWLNMVGAPEQLIHRATVVVKNEAFDDATC